MSLHQIVIDDVIGLTFLIWEMGSAQGVQEFGLGQYSAKSRKKSLLEANMSTINYVEG